MNLGGMNVTVDVRNNILEFILWKGYVHGCWKKYKWPTKMPAIGLNIQILNYALKNNIIIKVIYKNQLWFVTPVSIKKVLENNWIAKKVGNGLIIYAIPLFLAKRSLESAKQESYGMITSYV